MKTAMAKAMVEAVDLETQKDKKQKANQWVISCANCGGFSWYEAKREGTEVYCPRCHHRFVLERPLVF